MPGGCYVRPSGEAASTEKETPSMDQVLDAVKVSVAWLDAANGRTDPELTLRILKVTEEAGEAAGAWIGVLGTNPRKGVTHSRDDVAAELADVVITALVAMDSLGVDVRTALRDCARKVVNRIAAPTPTT
jgi:NTP pyrophosphatase (non-canonical NTP hydrolase)